MVVVLLEVGCPRPVLLQCKRNMRNHHFFLLQDKEGEGEGDAKVREAAGSIAS